MQWIYSLFLIVAYLIPLEVNARIVKLKVSDDLEIKTKRLRFKDFPCAFNPSLHETDQGILLSFRFCPDFPALWISKIAVVKLNESMDPISVPQLLDIRSTDVFPPYYDDSKFFSFQGKLYILYSDSTEFNHSPDPSFNPIVFREDMFIAEIKFENERFVVGTPVKLFYKEKYATVLRQKNWVPFEWGGKLFMSYYLFPHEVLEVNVNTGNCQYAFLTHQVSAWDCGQLRGTTPAILVDGDYLAFGHSVKILRSPASKGKPKNHYFMGAYTFSSQPPFEIKKVSPTPIIAKKMYTPTNYPAVVIYPGGNIVIGDTIYVSYGKNDSEVWIAKMSLKELKATLVPVKSK